MLTILFSVIGESCGEINGCTSGESWCEDESYGNILLSFKNFHSQAEAFFVESTLSLLVD
jgi:hypothetical protein